MQQLGWCRQQPKHLFMAACCNICVALTLPCRCSVPWIDDKGNVQINRGFRVQFNSAIGPFKVRLTA
jgi:glutamate dehydrogenase/leucine dehydrogenase